MYRRSRLTAQNLHTFIAIGKNLEDRRVRVCSFWLPLAVIEPERILRHTMDETIP